MIIEYAFSKALDAVGTKIKNATIFFELYKDFYERKPAQHSLL